MRVEIAPGAALARAALAGNPSDGYGGAVLALALPGLVAQAVARRARAVQISPDGTLVQAAIDRFARDLHEPAARTEVRWSTSIPREVGLGGSSAIVIATLRALSALYQVRLGEGEMAELALAVEVEDLGISAGLQDRVAQCYGGLVYMDFAADGGSYERVNLSRLPPLLIAWRPGASVESGAVHAALRKRYDRGEPVVVEGMEELGRLGRAAHAALAAGDTEALARCIDQSFDVRQRMISLDSRHVDMIARARRVGASANYAGSGGAIVAVCRDMDHRLEVERELHRAGCETLTPFQ